MKSDLQRIFREMAGLQLHYDPEGSTRAIPERLYGEVLEQLSLALARRTREPEREPATPREPEPEWFRFEGVVGRELGTDGGVWVFRADDDPTEEENEAVLEIRATPHIVQPPTEGGNDAKG